MTETLLGERTKNNELYKERTSEFRELIRRSRSLILETGDTEILGIVDDSCRDFAFAEVGALLFDEPFELFESESERVIDNLRSLGVGAYGIAARENVDTRQTPRFNPNPPFEINWSDEFSGRYIDSDVYTQFPLDMSRLEEIYFETSLSYNKYRHDPDEYKNLELDDFVAGTNVLLAPMSAGIRIAHQLNALLHYLSNGEHSIEIIPIVTHKGDTRGGVINVDQVSEHIDKRFVFMDDYIAGGITLKKVYECMEDLGQDVDFVYPYLYIDPSN